jgi:hypothetical protein
MKAYKIQKAIAKRIAEQIKNNQPIEHIPVGLGKIVIWCLVAQLLPKKDIVLNVSGYNYAHYQQLIAEMKVKNLHITREDVMQLQDYGQMMTRITRPISAKTFAAPKTMEELQSDESKLEYKKAFENYLKKKEALEKVLKHKKNWHKSIK